MIIMYTLLIIDIDYVESRYSLTDIPPHHYGCEQRTLQTFHERIILGI